MSTLNTSLTRYVTKYGVRIATALSIGVLVTAANFRSPSFFLVLPAWVMLGSVASVRFGKVRDQSPYKEALYAMAIPLLFLAPLWKTAFAYLIDVLLQPSLANLIRFGTCRPLLALAALYFAAACLFHGIERRKHDEIVTRYKESIELLSAELQCRSGATESP